MSLEEQSSKKVHLQLAVSDRRLQTLVSRYTAAELETGDERRKEKGAAFQIPRHLPTLFLVVIFRCQTVSGQFIFGK